MSDVASLPRRRTRAAPDAPALPVDTRRTMLIGGALIALAVFGLGIWASTVPIASAVVANGQLVVASKRKQVQHLTGGVIRKLFVQDGARVAAGDGLVELDDADARERFVRTRDTYFLAIAAEARVIAEHDDLAEPKFPDELNAVAKSDPAVAGLLDGQRRLFQARRSELRGQLSIMEDEHRQLMSQLTGLEAERSSALAQAELTRHELKVVSDLFEKGYTTRTRVFGLKRDIEQLSGAAARLKADIARTRTAANEAQLKLQQVRYQLRSQLQNDLRETQAKIPNLREQYNAGRLAFERMTLRAPVAGTVVGLKVHTVGAVVAPGDTVMEIVPAGDRLMVEVMLRPTDVDSVKVGLETDIRFTGLSQQGDVPLISGRVTRVSADALVDPRTNATYFVAEVDVSGEQLRRLGRHRLQPGMPAAAMIKTGERTALAYLTQPLTDSISRAWREQ